MGSWQLIPNPAKGEAKRIIPRHAQRQRLGDSCAYRREKLVFQSKKRPLRIIEVSDAHFDV